MNCEAVVKLIGFQQMSWHIIPGLSSFQINLELFLKNSQTQADPAKKKQSSQNQYLESEFSRIEYLFVDSCLEIGKDV